VIVVFFLSEVITFIWRSALHNQHADGWDLTSDVLKRFQLGVNVFCFIFLAIFIGTSDKRVFEVHSHHLFTFFPYLVLTALNTISVRFYQTSEYLQLGIDLFGYAFLQLIAGVHVTYSHSKLVFFGTVFFVVIIVIGSAIHESQSPANLDFIRGVVEQILVLECIHLTMHAMQ